MDHFVPAYCAPCEHYWQAVLSEGPVARGESLEFWEWIETPVTLPEIWEEAKALQRHGTVLELQITGYNRGGLIASWQGIECFIPASHLIDYPFQPIPRRGRNASRRTLDGLSGSASLRSSRHVIVSCSQSAKWRNVNSANLSGPNGCASGPCVLGSSPASDPLVPSWTLARLRA